jgi:hypothetical protein
MAIDIDATLKKRSILNRKAEPPKARLGRRRVWAGSMLIAFSLCFSKDYSVAANKPKEYKVNTLKQITFHKMNYNFEQFYCLNEIIYKESRWNYKAKNPKSSAFGLFQILKSTEKDPIKQIDLGLKYLDRRYDGCACKALAFHNRNGWW